MLAMQENFYASKKTLDEEPIWEWSDAILGFPHN
jgi:hypothetical protein